MKPPSTSCGNVFRDIFRGIFKMPSGMLRICIIQVLLTLALSCHTQQTASVNRD